MAAPDRDVVMIAVDNSDTAEQAFKWYMENCHRPQHAILIAHCIEKPAVYGMADPQVINMWIEEVKRDSIKIQEKYTSLLKARGVGADYLTSMEQSPCCWIVEKAKEHNPKLIVMGSRGLGTVRRTILGSVSDYVLHHAHCAVAVCHASDELKQTKVASGYTLLK